MPLNITQPLPWNSSHAKQAISFGINSPTNGLRCGYTSITNVNGKAVFEVDPGETEGGFTYPPPSRFFYTPTGPHPGVVHVITEITTGGLIYTDTDYVSNDGGDDSTVLPNLTYRLWWDTATPASGESIDIKPFWKNDGTLVVNLSEYLRSIFPSPIPPPVIGTDINMYRLFSVEIAASQDFEDWCDDFSLDSATLILAMTNWNWDDYVWRVIRGVIPHGQFNADFLGASDVLAISDPVVHPGGTIVSKIVSNQVINYTV